MTTVTPPTNKTAARSTPKKVNRRRMLWRTLGVVVLLMLLALLLAPQWGRPLLAEAMKRALLAEGWQEVELQVTSLGATQARLSAVRMENRYTGIEIPELTVTFSPYELLTRKRVKGVIASRARVQARFARQVSDVVAAPLLLQWPDTGKRLPFDRIYLSDVQIVPEPSSGIAALNLNAVLEHTPGRADALRLWAEAKIAAPYAYASFSAEIDLKKKALKGTLDSEFTELEQWRRIPLPPEAAPLLSAVRERLTLQAAVSIKDRSSLNWMLFGQSPAAVYTAPNGAHVEALNVDFGVNVIGADRLDYGWVRAASGAAQSAEGSIEWDTLRAEIKPSQYVTAHIQKAQLRADLSSVARELMPQQLLWRELSGAWRTQTWQAGDLSATLYARDIDKARQPFFRLAGEMKFGPLEYPWEKTEMLSYPLQEELLQIPLLRPLILGQPTATQQQDTQNRNSADTSGTAPTGSNGSADGNDFGGLTLPPARN